MNLAPNSTLKQPVYHARARYRDADGVTRSVLRSGQTKAAAKRALVESLTQRSALADVVGAAVRPSMAISDLADEWVAQRQASWSQNTRSRYLLDIRYIKERLGGVKLRTHPSRRQHGDPTCA